MKREPISSGGRPLLVLGTWRRLEFTGGRRNAPRGRLSARRASTVPMDSWQNTFGWVLILMAAFFARPAVAAPPIVRSDCATSGCHSETRDGDFAHELVEAGNCESCHQPVAGERKTHPNVNTELPIGDIAISLDAACLSCHAEEFEPDRQRSLTSANSEASSEDAEVQQHGPVAKGRCGECHLVHSGRSKGLLRGTYPMTNYATYDRALYSSCFESCHSPDLIELQPTLSATRFRNGPDNLHFRHVAALSKGRSCRMCHASHQARNSGLVRSSIPFGKERLTLDFTAGETGGRCASSCHLPVEYDRDEAVPSRMKVLEPHSVLESRP